MLRRLIIFDLAGAASLCFIALVAAARQVVHKPRHNGFAENLGGSEVSGSRECPTVRGCLWQCGVLVSA